MAVQAHKHRTGLMNIMLDVLRDDGMKESRLVTGFHCQGILLPHLIADFQQLLHHTV